MQRKLYPVVATIGELDLALYTGYDSSDDTTSYPTSHLGRVWYTLNYNIDEEQLYIVLIKARHLPSDINADCPKDCCIRQVSRWEHTF